MLDHRAIIIFRNIIVEFAVVVFERVVAVTARILALERVAVVTLIKQVHGLRLACELQHAAKQKGWHDESRTGCTICQLPQAFESEHYGVVAARTHGVLPASDRVQRRFDSALCQLSIFASTFKISAEVPIT